MTAAASAVGAFVRRRAAIRARDLQIEAELQEMIAEARTEDRVGPRSD
jgi:hypothetical protein